MLNDTKSQANVGAGDPPTIPGQSRDVTISAQAPNPEGFGLEPK